MRIKLALALALLPALLSAQERYTVRGRIVDEQGAPVEYVQVGVPRLGIGAVSTADGRFEIAVPRDTLQFFHVSYQPAACAVTGPADDVVIVLREQELPPAVAIAGAAREKYLLRPGTAILKDMGIISTAIRSEHPTGRELGTVARAKKPFLVKEILFSVRCNNIPGCVASINIYRIEGERESFVNVLRKPIYFKIPVSDAPQDFDIRPGEAILLEPGDYFIAFQVVGCDGQALQTYLARPEEERDSRAMTMDFNVFLKSSYIREVALGGLEAIPVNIGVAVKGLEYQ